MYNIMGLNAPNSKYFCLYCDCEASDRWNMDLHWTINKNTKSKCKFIKIIFIELILC
jgi:hypothetical protein